VIGQYRGKRLFAGRLFVGRLFGPAAVAPPAPGGAGRFYTPGRKRRRDKDDDVLLFLLR
jgi:hypothetical protein